MFCLVSSGNEKHRLLPIDRKKLRPCTMEPVFSDFFGFDMWAYFPYVNKLLYFIKTFMCLVYIAFGSFY